MSLLSFYIFGDISKNDKMSIPVFRQKRDLTKRPLPQLQQNSVYHDAFLQGDIMTEKVFYFLNIENNDQF